MRSESNCKWNESSDVLPQTLYKILNYKFYHLHRVWVGDSLFSAVFFHTFVSIVMIYIRNILVFVTELRSDLKNKKRSKVL